MYVFAVIASVAIGLTVWFLASYWIAWSISWVEDHHPDLIGSKRLRVGEVIACGGLVLACFILAVWIGRLLWG